MSFDPFELAVRIAQRDALATDNVISIADRKDGWTAEECLAVVAREKPLRVSIVADLPNGTSVTFNSKMTVKDMLFHAKMLEERAWNASE